MATVAAPFSSRAAPTPTTPNKTVRFCEALRAQIGKYRFFVEIDAELHIVAIQKFGSIVTLFHVTFLDRA